MTPTTDEQMMRSALAELTSGQPPAPPDRLQGVRRRAIRHRRQQLAGVLVAALAVAGIAVGAARLPAMLNGPPQSRQVPGWALAWRDYRNGSVPQSVLDNAVLAWRSQTTGVVSGQGGPTSSRRISQLVAPYHVIWYVGQTVARGQDVAVMFEANSPGTGPTLVVGFATASEVMHGQAAWSGDGSSPWVLRSVAAPSHPGSFGPDISEYVPVLSASGTATDNWIVVLSSPRAGLTIWGARTTAGGVSITGVPSRGLYVANAGQATADVLLGFGSDRAAFAPVGIPGAPDVPSLAPPVLTGSASAMDSYTGQGNELNDDKTVDRSGGPYGVTGVCYNAAPGMSWWRAASPGGHGPVRVTVNGHSIGSIACDGQQHLLTVPYSVLRPHGAMIGFRSSDLTSWQIAFGKTR